MQTTRRGFFGVLAAVVVVRPSDVVPPAIPARLTDFSCRYFGCGLTRLHGRERILQPVDLSRYVRSVRFTDVENEWHEEWFGRGLKPSGVGIC